MYETRKKCDLQIIKTVFCQIRKALVLGMRRKIQFFLVLQNTVRPVAQNTILLASQITVFLISQNTVLLISQNSAFLVLQSTVLLVSQVSFPCYGNTVLLVFQNTVLKLKVSLSRKVQFCKLEFSCLANDSFSHSPK